LDTKKQRNNGGVSAKKIPSFDIPSGKHTKTMENHHVQWVNPLQMAIFNN
jgi:hypothetical protein